MQLENGNVKVEEVFNSLDFWKSRCSKIGKVIAWTKKRTYSNVTQMQLLALLNIILNVFSLLRGLGLSK